MDIVAGEASEQIVDMPAPDCVFIGGSGGNLCKMLDIIYTKNSDCRVVINAITLETLIEVVEYYKNNNTLNNADKILAVESLGLEAESNQFDISSVDFSKTSLSKKIVTEVLLGIDPTEDKETLESQIDENGNVEGSWGASSDIWTLYALYATSSEKTKLLADKLNTDLASWYFQLVT